MKTDPKQTAGDAKYHAHAHAVKFSRSRRNRLKAESKRIADLLAASSVPPFRVCGGVRYVFRPSEIPSAEAAK